MTQLWVFIFVLHSLGLIGGQLCHSRHGRLKRGSVVSKACHGGCRTCSEFNGCLSCKPRLFFHLEQSGTSERGVCLPFCPRGHYGNRSPLVNMCSKCGDACESCFSRGFCTRCRAGLYLHRGRCADGCPEGLYQNHAPRECTACSVGCVACVSADTCTRCRAGVYLQHGQCHLTCPGGSKPNGLLQECTPTVHCEVGGWGEWGSCARRGRSCGFRRGVETRKRRVLQPPSPHGNPCPITMENRNCIVKRRKCPGR